MRIKSEMFLRQKMEKKDRDPQPTGLAFLINSPTPHIPCSFMNYSDHDEDAFWLEARRKNGSCFTLTLRPPGCDC